MIHKKNRIYITVLIILLIVISALLMIKIQSNVSTEKAGNEIFDYLKYQEYTISSSTINDDGFVIKAKKDNTVISVEFTKSNSKNPNCTVYYSNGFDDYNGKYNINYEEIAKISKILPVKTLNKNTIKKACEDKRDFYDSSNSDYI